MSHFERITDHVAQGLSKRSSAYYVESVAALMVPLLEEIQHFEDVLWSVFDSRFVDKALKDGLVKLGGVLGEHLDEDGIESLRLRIKLKAQAIRSYGRREELLSILSLISGTEWYIEGGGGFLQMMQVGGPATVELFHILDLASGDGVTLFLTQPVDDTPTFFWGSYDETIEGSPWGSYDETITSAPWAHGRIS